MLVWKLYISVLEYLVFWGSADIGVYLIVILLVIAILNLGRFSDIFF